MASAVLPASMAFRPSILPQHAPFSLASQVATVTATCARHAADGKKDAKPIPCARWLGYAALDQKVGKLKGTCSQLVFSTGRAVPMLSFQKQVQEHG